MGGVGKAATAGLGMVTNPLGSVGGALFKDPAADAMKANLKNEAIIKQLYTNQMAPMAANQQRAMGYGQQATDTIKQGGIQALAQMQGAGTSAKLGVDTQAKTALAGAQQGLASRGMGTSSMNQMARQSSAQGSAKAYAAIDEAVAQMKAGLLMQNAQALAGAQTNQANIVQQNTGQNVGLSSNYAQTLGGIQHTGGPSLFQQLLVAGAGAMGGAMGAGGLGGGKQKTALAPNYSGNPTGIGYSPFD